MFLNQQFLKMASISTFLLGILPKDQELEKVIWPNIALSMRTGFHFWSFQVPPCSPFHHSEIGFHFVIIWVQLNFSHLLWHNYPFDNTQTPSRQHPDTTQTPQTPLPQTDSIGKHWEKRQKLHDIAPAEIFSLVLPLLSL